MLSHVTDHQQLVKKGIRYRMSVTLASHFNSQGFYTSNTLEQISLKFTVHFAEDNLL